MSSVPLTPVSYLVLGLIARNGPATPYDLKRLVSRSIGFFWAFPHSQLYAEPQRLAAAGLLREEREPRGRRRRTFAITGEGLAALREWLQTPVVQPPQVRHLGVLKLFFGEFADRDDIVALAHAQAAFHDARLEELKAAAEWLRERPDLDHPYATLRLGLAMEGALAQFWADVAERPPRTRRATEDGRGSRARPQARRRAGADRRAGRAGA